MAQLETVNIRPMTISDIDQVMIVEHSAFDVPWSRNAFENELVNNHFAAYFVAEYGQKIIAYCGVWVIVDEAHITNLAVLDGYRGNKVGETLLRKVMLYARAKGARTVSLEVRVGNDIAKNLYRKLGFRSGGIRKNYYSNNGEDALVMWVRL
ncbi:ribosomal protein S18-alanine N-acetyltransferase [Sporolactobacillus pectinivorans]|uniref:ribosomal protein S18-alanine N-acetyltransferase n=1 Tax=Sporolactobacillus pectinivorans TaxID=1591408 RepID=UPI0018745A4D|nr:ribosomal protein S18-alanine N-acetyltransferase [Sporolactobacillus pectinivorans]